ncbi:MAG: amidase [Gemmatimonadaceae bacterium]|nr:amidase [Gemmatimonadaceae bacterium]
MPDTNAVPTGHDRRKFLAHCTALGVGGTLLPGVLWAKIATGAELTKDTIACAEELAGVHFSDVQRQQMLDSVKGQAAQIEGIHRIRLDNSVAPSVVFDPIPPGATLQLPPKRPTVRSKVSPRAVPSELEELAFLPVTELSELVRRRKVTSTQLTRMYLARMRRYDPVLKCVISYTESRALEQARNADEEIARGSYRGPLHGIPWGAKDLLAVKGYKTTWGAGPFREQTIDADAAVVQRLDAAGAVLIAKLTLGELAQGDIWFGGTTKNPWNVVQGSSGSSAGPGSSVAAGLVGFAIGTETLGSISSPATRNGVTGLRPTFGRVPRTGAMALSWTMDKIGPMARSVEDCALVLEAIHGPDNVDRAVKSGIPFSWDARLALSSLRIGYVKSAFDLPERNEKNQLQHGTKRFDDAALETLRSLGVTPIAVEIPDADYAAMRLVLRAEAAAAFDELTRSGRDKELVQQTAGDWANTFRAARLIPAVDYVNANRARTLVMQRWHELFKTVDVIVAPTSSAQLTATNLTGHPAVILPSGFRDTSDTDKTQVPVSLTFLGGLYQEAQLLAVAKAWQDATTFHTRHPVVKV